MWSENEASLDTWMVEESLQLDNFYDSAVVYHKSEPWRSLNLNMETNNETARD